MPRSTTHAFTMPGLVNRQASTVKITTVNENTPRSTTDAFTMPGLVHRPPEVRSREALIDGAVAGVR